MVSQEVVLLIKRGISINKIVQITGCPKSTIYYHYKKIKGKKIKPIELNFKNTNEIGEFLGIFAGDGSFIKGKNSHYTIRICLGYYEKEYAYFLAQQLTLWFNKRPHIYYSKYHGELSGITLHYDSKIIYIFLQKYLEWFGKKTYSIRLRKLDIQKRSFNFGFLRGLIDTDGNYYHKKRRITFAITSPLLFQQAVAIIKYNAALKPNCYITKKKDRADLYTLTLHGKNANKLITLIRPNNPSKIAPVV